ncbi:unnamed protein product [Alopecurus aequalis]
MGNSGVDRRLVKEEGKAAGQEEDRSVIKEKLNCTRLELQKTLALSADADDTLCGLGSALRRVAQEREEAFRQRNALLAELQARRNAQAMMAALASGGSPAAAAFSCHSNQSFVVPFGRMTAQEQYYARAAGVSYCFASSLSRTSGQDSFDPDMFLVDAAEGDSAAPATATVSGVPGVEGKKSSGSELGLVAEQILGLPRMKGEAVEAPVHDDDDGTSVEEASADSESTEVDDENFCGGGGGSLADVVSAAGKKQSDAS